MKKFLAYGLFLCLCSNFLSAQTNSVPHSLSGLEQHAATVEEFPLDGLDWVNPDFSTHHFGSGFMDLLYEVFDVPGKALVSFDEFKSLLDEAQRVRQKQKDLKFVSAQPGSHCFVWGPLFGAFHSLVRTLRDLEQRGIINEQLQIQGDHYCFFLGDVIGRAPYNIEALAVVLMFMIQNPDKVFYFTGTQEYKGTWRNFSTKTQLHGLRWYDRCADQIELFYDALSDSIPVVISTEQDKQILMAYDGIVPLEVCEPMNQDKKTVCPPKRDTLVLVQADRPLYQMHGVKSLLAYGYEYGAFMWNVFSSPTKVHQVYRDYFNDAYIDIKLGKTIGDSFIESRVHHIYNDKDFHVSGSYNLLSGAKNGEVVDDSKMYPFGSSLALTGGAEVHGTYLQEGMLARLGIENKAGGVHNYLLRPFFYNDHYNPIYTRQNIEYLLKNYGIDVFVGSLGSAALKSYQDLVIDRKIAALFPSTGSPIFRSEDLKGAVFLRAAYDREFRELLEYILKRYGSKRFAFFYQNDSFGRPPVQEAVKKLKDRGISDILQVPYGRAQVDFAVDAEKIIAFKPDAIGIVATAKPTMELLRQIGSNNLINTSVFAVSTLCEDTFKRFMVNRGIPYTVSHYVPSPVTSSIDLVKEYRATMDKHGLPYDDFTLEGYISIDLFIHALDALKPPFNNGAILDVMESWKNVTYKGLSLNFNPKTRQLIDYLWIETVYPD